MKLPLTVTLFYRPYTATVSGVNDVRHNSCSCPQVVSEYKMGTVIYPLLAGITSHKKALVVVVAVVEPESVFATSVSVSR